MGSGHWDSKSWSTYATSTVGKTTDKIFTTSRSEIKKELNPLGVAIRESRDSVDNPKSTPLIVGIDVTGSMGMLADVIAREGLGTLFSEVLDRKPISDPHIMFMAIGDANFDSFPLQVSQFEADDRIIEQLTGINIEKGGGGNRFESYNMPWYFAATHTATDSMEKRKKKGYLFTIGDEQVPGDLLKSQIKRFIGDDVERDMTSAELLAMAQRTYHVFHLMVEEGNHMRGYHDVVVNGWRDLLGQNALLLSDHRKLSEVIVSAIQVTEGEDKAAVAASWKGDTAIVVAKAIAGLPAAGKKGKGAGVVRFGK